MKLETSFRFLMIVGTCCLLQELTAQDRILLRDSTDIQGKILRAGRDTVLYTTTNSDGTEYKIATTRISSIVYENGSTARYFTGQSKASSTLALDSQELAQQKIGTRAELDASRNNRTFPGGKVAGALAFFLTPVGGLLPAAAIALVTPPKRRWTTFDSTYASNETYVRSYRKEIRRDKLRYTIAQYKQGSYLFWVCVLIGAGIWLL